MLNTRCCWRPLLLISCHESSRFLQWPLGIYERIHFKLVLLVDKVRGNPFHPIAIIHRCTYNSSIIGRSSLRSASSRKYVVPGTSLVFGRHSFTVTGRTTWSHPLPRFLLSFTKPIFRSQPKTSSNPCLGLIKSQYFLLSGFKVHFRPIVIGRYQFQLHVGLYIAI